MATWKKMAEAFGRAVKRPGTGARGKQFEDAAERAGAGVEFNHGRLEGDMAEEDAAKAARDSGPKYQKAFDKAVDKQTDDRLENEFKQGFEEAVARRKEDRLNEWDWDGKPENQKGDDWDYEAAKDRDEAAEQQVRDELIKELNSGIPLSDFFEKYRNYGE